MKIKLAFLSLILVFPIFCLIPGNGGNPAINQNIKSEITKNLSQAFEKDTAEPDENIFTDNQTIIIKNPTFQQVKDFILKDTTSRNRFILNKYECRHFATDVNNNAEAAGLRCAFVLLCFNNGQHAVVGFDTVDKGMIYIEPQTDAAIQAEVGGRYQGQEITEILISW